MKNKPALCFIFSGTGRRLEAPLPGRVPYRPTVGVGAARCNPAPACADTACMDVVSRDLDAATLGTAFEHVSVPRSPVGWPSDGKSILAIGVNNADMLFRIWTSGISSE